jgi:hypothetical protein
MQHAKTIGLFALILLCIGGIIRIQQPKLKILTNTEVNNRDYQREEDREAIQVNFLKNLPTFGFSNLIANWTMLQFIQYYGDGEARKQQGSRLTPDYLEAVVKHDPRFVQAYLILSPASSISAGKPERTIGAMNQGLKVLTPEIPESYYVWLYKGIDELLFLGDIPGAKKSYAKAAEWAAKAGNQHIADIASGTVKFLETNPDSRTAQVGAWFIVYTNTRDLETRKIAKENIERLGGQLIEYDNGRRVRVLPPKTD